MVKKLAKEICLKTAKSIIHTLVSLFEELKPEYQEYILKQIDQLLDIQHNEK